LQKFSFKKGFHGIDLHPRAILALRLNLGNLRPLKQDCPRVSFRRQPISKTLTWKMIIAVTAGSMMTKDFPCVTIFFSDRAKPSKQLIYKRM
jgi:hypothetical protein